MTNEAMIIKAIVICIDVFIAIGKVIFLQAFASHDGKDAGLVRHEMHIAIRPLRIAFLNASFFKMVNRILIILATSNLDAIDKWCNDFSLFIIAIQRYIDGKLIIKEIIIQNISDQLIIKPSRFPGP